MRRYLFHLLRIVALIGVLFLISTKESLSQDLLDSISEEFHSNIPYNSFIGPTTDIVKLNNHYFICPGITMGIMIKEKFLFGLYANFVINHTHVEDVESLLFNVKYEYGGVWLGYVFHPIENLQFGISAKMGKAYIELQNNKSTVFSNKDVLMATPALDIFYSVNSWLKINLSSGFRMTTDLKLVPINKHYFNGPNTTIGLLFGN